jgi:hypothetical protein
LVEGAVDRGTDLEAHTSTQGLNNKLVYNATGGVVCEVVLDGMTGQVEIVRADINMNMGKSLNPLVDMGQIQGAFVMGAGHVLCESVSRPEKDGFQVDWFDYHPPTPWEAPKEWRIQIDVSERNKKNGSMGAKTVGEFAVVMGTASVGEALQRAICEVQREQGRQHQRAPMYPLTTPLRRALCQPRAGLVVDAEVIHSVVIHSGVIHSEIIHSSARSNTAAVVHSESGKLPVNTIPRIQAAAAATEVVQHREAGVIAHPSTTDRVGCACLPGRRKHQNA